MSGPIHARLFRSEIRNSGEMLQYDAYANLAIEGEMAVRIGTNGGIGAAFPVIELHHFVFRGPRKTLAELVANNGINAGADSRSEEHTSESLTNLVCRLLLEKKTPENTCKHSLPSVTFGTAC